MNIGAGGGITGTLANSGFINLLQPANPPTGQAGYFDHLGSITNQGAFHVFGPFLNVETGVFSNSGSLVVDAGSVLGPIPDSVTNQSGATISGDGTIKVFFSTSLPVLVNHGVISPGDANFGQLSINASLNELSDATLHIRIGGTSAGTTYDQLAVVDQGFGFNRAQLGGFLAVDLADGYVPAPSDAFTIMTGAIVPGSAFANTSGNRVAVRHGSFQVIYGSNSVVLTDFAAAEPSTAVLLAIAAVAMLPLEIRRRVKRAPARS